MIVEGLCVFLHPSLFLDHGALPRETLMFTPETDASWLAETWNRCRQSDFLDRLEVHRLVHGFIGVNLVRDLAEFLWTIANGGGIRLAGGVTAGEVDSWLGNRSDPVRWARLTLPRTRTEINNGPDREHPWRRIYHWTARAALLQYLEGGEAQTLAYTWALDVFRDLVPGGKCLPEVCQQRNSATVRDFQAWWRDVVGRLTRWLDQERWERIRELERAPLTQLLLKILDPQEPCPVDHPCPLTQLTLSKNQQWQVCLEQRNFNRIPPLNEEWFGGMTRRLLAAVEQRCPMEWNGEDGVNFTSLWRWMQDQGLDPELEGILLPDPQAMNVLQVIDSPDVVFLAEWWARMQTIRENRLESIPQAQDLFCHPRPLRWRS
jgi:hypothetical protein